MSRHFLFLAALVALAISLQGVVAVRFEVINYAKTKPSGIRFEREIGIPYTKHIMSNITNFIFNKILRERTPFDRKPVKLASVYIVEYKGAEAITWGDKINVSSVYLQGYQGNLKWEYTSLLFHEMTHVYQWNGEGKTPVGLIEGIADYSILKANYYPPAFAKPGQGDRWDQGYDYTTRFLEYCDGFLHGFVAALNKKMRYTYSDNYFVELLGKPVDQLWREYKSKYGQLV